MLRATSLLFTFVVLTRRGPTEMETGAIAPDKNPAMGWNEWLELATFPSHRSCSIRKQKNS